MEQGIDDFVSVGLERVLQGLCRGMP